MKNLISRGKIGVLGDLRLRQFAMRRHATIESLERRHLLSTTLASVTGSVATVNFDSKPDPIALIASGTTLTVTNATGETVILTGVSTILVNGQTGSQTLNINGLLGSTDGLELHTGEFVLDPTGASDVESIALASLTVDAGTTAEVQRPAVAGTNYVLTLGQLILQPGSGATPAASLALNGADMLVRASGSGATASLQAVSSAVHTGYAGGLENGTGIQSGSVDSSLYTLAVAPAGSTGSFDGVAVAPTDILVRQLLYGDANFDGRVDGSDYTLIDNGFLHHLTGWTNGDFNSDGVVNGSDYALIDNAFKSQPDYNSNPTTVNFASSANQLFLLGNFSTGNYLGHNYQGQTGSGELDTEVVGSSATFQAFMVPNTVVTITVDGTVSTFTSTSPAFQFIPIFSGLSDSPHHVVISTQSQPSLYFDSDNTLQVTGSQPRLQAPSFAGPSGHAQYLQAFSSPFSTYAAFDGDPTYIAGYGEIWPAGGTGTGAGVRFRAAVTDISYWTNNNSANLPRFVVYQDGVPIATSTIIPQQPFWNVQPLVSGLDGQPHEYQIIPIDPGGYVQLFGVILGGGTGLSTTTQEPVKPQWAFFGDTDTSGAGIATNSDRFNGDIRQTDAWMLTNFENVGAIIDGNAGAGMDNFAVSHTSNITSLSPAPAVVFSRFGTDDIINGVPVAQFQSDYYTYLNLLLKGLPSTTILYAEGVFPAVATYFSAATRATYNAAIKAACAQTDNPRVRYVDTTNWFNPAVDTNYAGVLDGLHPSAAGFVKIFNAEIPVVAANSYRVTGPTSGPLGKQSTLFTVTLAVGATFTGYQTITVSDGGAGGTITPSVGSAAESSLTFTPQAGTNSFTFTYTPLKSGKKSIAFTDGQPGWTDPMPITFSVN